MPRPRKSLHDHAIQGTRPEYVQDGPSDYPAGRPKMPLDLPATGQAEWKRITKQLAKRKTLTKVDASALEVYCRMFAQWLGYCAHVENHGPMIEEPVKDKNGDVYTRWVQNPAAKLALQLGNALRQYQKEFSATPASRERTKPAQQEPKPKPPAELTEDEQFAALVDHKRSPLQHGTY